MSGGTPGSTHRPAERPSDDIDDFVDVGIRFAAFGRGPDAAAHVVLENQDPDRVEGGSQGKPRQGAWLFVLVDGDGCGTVFHKQRAG